MLRGIRLRHLCRLVKELYCEKMRMRNEKVALHGVMLLASMSLYMRLASFGSAIFAQPASKLLTITSSGLKPLRWMEPRSSRAASSRPASQFAFKTMEKVIKSGETRCSVIRSKTRIASSILPSRAKPLMSVV